MNHIRYAGYDASHPADFVFDIPEGHDCYLFLLTHTRAEFWVNGILSEYPAGSAILYPPGYKIYYRACSTSYVNDWIRFDTDESYAAALPLKGIPFPVSDPEYCHSLVRLLTWESSFLTDNSPLIISNLLHTLFLKLFEDSARQEHDIHGQKLLALRKDILNNPGLPWKVQDMACRLHISAGYLQLLYKKKFGVSCMDDVIKSRIHKAKELLLYTDDTAAEIAASCGYPNPEHFNRQFRKYTGISPGAFRKTARFHASQIHPLPKCNNPSSV